VNRKAADVIVLFRFKALFAAANVIAATASPTLASEGLTPVHPVASKRLIVARAPAVPIGGAAGRKQPAHLAWNGSHNPNLILGVAY
jgi:hypothetical protein